MEQPSDDTPSVTPCRACQLPQGGSREGAYHSTCLSETGRLRAIFIAPTKLNFPGMKKPGNGFHKENVTGWARAPTYWYHPKA